MILNRYENHYKCLICECDVHGSIKRYSLKNYGVTLCITHQKETENVIKTSTEYALRLFFALRIREIPAEIEKFDGFKHIDIAIPKAKLNIEVDGVHHNFDSKQALSDLKRTCYSLFKGYYTIRIPNSLVYRDDTLEETADYLTELINELIRRRSF